MGSEGGWMDLNLGTPEPVLSATRSENPRVVLGSCWRRSVKEEEEEEELGMKGCAEKVKLLADKVSKLPEEEEAMKTQRDGF